jgi:hypothetical protein
LEPLAAKFDARGAVVEQFNAGQGEDALDIAMVPETAGMGAPTASVMIAEDGEGRSVRAYSEASGTSRWLMKSPVKQMASGRAAIARETASAIIA